MAKVPHPFAALPHAVTLFDEATGELGPQLTGRSTIAAHVLGGQRFVEGHHDRRTRKVNPATGRLVKRTPPLAEIKADLVADVARKRRKAESQGAETRFGPAQTDRRSMGRLALLGHWANGEGDHKIAWTLADNGTVELTRDQARQLLADVFAHAAACHARANELKQAIAAALGPAALAKIDIHAGWPGQKEA